MPTLGELPALAHRAHAAKPRHVGCRSLAVTRGCSRQPRRRGEGRCLDALPRNGRCSPCLLWNVPATALGRPNSINRQGALALGVYLNGRCPHHGCRLRAGKVPFRRRLGLAPPFHSAEHCFRIRRCFTLTHSTRKVYAAQANLSAWWRFLTCKMFTVAIQAAFARLSR
jgi:hypothetical protein